MKISLTCLVRFCRSNSGVTSVRALTDSLYDAHAAKYAAKRGGLLELRLGGGRRASEEDLYSDGKEDESERARVFPARLVNLPCVVEVHKTVDYVTLFKSADVGQMVVVYKDEAAMLEDMLREEEERGKMREKGGKDDEGKAELSLRAQLDYYHSGLTPPTTNIVRRRFAETRMHGPYPAATVAKVQGELAAHVAALEEKREVSEVVEDVVDFEDYMADMHGQPVTIAEDSALWLEHPELLIHRPVVLAPDDPALGPAASALPAAPKPFPADAAYDPAFIQEGSTAPTSKGSSRPGKGGGGRGSPVRGRGGRSTRSARSGRRGRTQRQGGADASPAARAAASDSSLPPVAISGCPEGASAPLIMLEPPAGPPSYGEMQPPPPPPSHRRHREPKESRITGGQRVGGPVITGNLPAPDVPPDPEFDNAFLGEDGEDDFLDFLEGGVEEEGGLMDEGFLEL